MTKKSGLGDSPLFPNPSKQQKPNNEKAVTIQVAKPIDVKAKKLQNRTNVRSDKRTDVQTNVRTNEQTDERTNVHTYRVIKRHPYDFYLDQVHFVAELALERSRQTGQQVALGEVMREIVDFYISKKKK